MLAHKAGVLYQHYQKKSRIFRFLFRKLNDFTELCRNIPIIFPLVRPQTIGAVLDSLGIIAEVAAAFFSQGIQGAVAEQATEGFRVCAGMTGIVLTFLILEKIVMTHGNLFSSPFGYGIISRKRDGYACFN